MKRFAPRPMPIHILKEYSRDSLDQKYHDLLDAIVQSASTEFFRDHDTKTFDRTASGRGTRSKDALTYEIGVLYDYLVDMTGEQLIQFKELLGKIGIPWNKSWNKISGRGCGRLNFEAAFCASAQVQGKSLKQHIVDYIRYGRRNYPGAVFYSLKEHGKAIDAILKECSRPLAQETQLPRKRQHHFSADIDRLLTGDFVPREVVFQTIESYIEQNDRGYILIEGGAGTGKSWIIAKATRYFGDSGNFRCVWHFNRIGLKNRSVDLVRSLFEQLSDVYELGAFAAEYQRVRCEHRDTEAFLTDALDHLQESGQLESLPLLIMVDALDEVDTSDVGRAGVINTQGIPRSLPHNVFILVASRTFAHQSYSKSSLLIDLSMASDIQRNDIEEFIRRRLRERSTSSWVKRRPLSRVEEYTRKNSGKSDEDELVELLCRKSNLSFIYLFYVFIGAEHLDADALPKGLDEYYEREYWRLLGTDSCLGEVKRQVLLAISTFTMGMSVKRIAYYTGLETSLIEKVCREMAGSTALVKRSITAGGVTFVNFSHTSFYLFLKDVSAHNAAQDLHSDSRGDRVCRLAQNLRHDYNLVNCDFSWNIHEPELKEEFLRIVLPVYMLSDDRAEVSHLLMSSSFYQEVMHDSLARVIYGAALCAQWMEAERQGGEEGIFADGMLAAYAYITERAHSPESRSQAFNLLGNTMNLRVSVMDNSSMKCLESTLYKKLDLLSHCGPSNVGQKFKILNDADPAE